MFHPSSLETLTTTRGRAGLVSRYVPFNTSNAEETSEINLKIKITTQKFRGYFWPRCNQQYEALRTSKQPRAQVAGQHELAVSSSFQTTADEK